MNLYVSEHKKPYARYMSIKEFNAKHGTYIEENAEYEEYFRAAYEKGRKRAGIDEFITDKIYTIDEMGWKEKAKDLYEKGKRKAKELKEKAKKAAKKAKEAARAGAKAAKDAMKKKNVEPESLEDALGDDIPVESEYEEESADLQEIENIVSENAKDGADLKMDMQHLIQFKVTGMPLRDTLLKGRPRYLQAIKDYLKGDENAELKMSYRAKNRTVKIKDLKPDRSSLKQLLKSKPNGLRVVNCL